jgi:tetratricopeptide (TPR) repeat protein
MTEAVYERYKDALRRGHAAASKNRNAAALDAYSEAARLAPDRALPLVGMGTVLVRLGKGKDALSAFDAALDRSPADEAALRGRAEALAATGDRAAAADAFDRVVPLLDDTGRVAEAADAARRALELAESRGRRSAVRRYVERLRPLAAGDVAAAEALGRAEAVLSEVPSAVEEAAPPPPGFDPGAALTEIDEALEGGDPVAVRAAVLAAATGHRTAGLINTAIDACYLALAGSPGDPDVHLELAELYLDQDWQDLAVDKLALVARLADLTDDPDARRRVCDIAGARLPGEPRLQAICA